MKQKIFITGIAGMIGYHTAMKLHSEGYEVFGCDNFNPYYDPQLKYDREKLLNEAGIPPENILSLDINAINWASQLENMDNFIYEYIGMNLNSIKITDKHQDIFGWLELQDWNVIIIITLMTLVAGINMISALLILILEKTNMIGMLKALGSSNSSIRKIFLYNGGYLIAKGLFYGNVFGLLLCFLQYKFHVISLPKESYYIEYVPIKTELLSVLMINASTFTLCLVMLILPSFIVAKITPVKAIRFN